jgi:hypothetical protein
VAQVAPSAVELVEDPSSVPEAVAARVDWIEPVPMARIQRVLCRTGTGLLPIELPAERQLRASDPLYLRIDPERVLIFDLVSGANLSLGTAARAI